MENYIFIEIIFSLIQKKKETLFKWFVYIWYEKKKELVFIKEQEGLWKLLV